MNQQKQSFLDGLNKLAVCFVCLVESFIHTYIHTFIHTYIHSYIHTYIDTFILTHTHIYISGVGRCQKVGVAHRHVNYVPSVKSQYNELYFDIWLFTNIHLCQFIEKCGVKSVCVCGGGGTNIPLPPNQKSVGHMPLLLPPSLPTPVCVCVCVYIYIYILPCIKLV